MQDKWLKALPVVVKYMAAAGAVIYIFMFIAVALLRMGYPYELEFLEGMGIDHVQRVLDGKPIYVQPSVDFVPAIYTPLYYYVSAIPAMILGNGPLPLRLVSFLATLGCMALIFSFVRKETKHSYAALLAAGLFAATYYVSGGWFDLGRIDMLFVFFLLSAVWLLRFHRTRAGYIATGLLTMLAFLTKQTGLLPAMFFVLYGLKMRKQYGWYLVISTILFIGLSTLLFDRATGGWFTFYVVTVPAKHFILPIWFIKFIPQDIFRPLPLAALFSILFLINRGLKGAKDDLWFYLLVGLGIVAAAAAPRVKDGNYVSDLIPLYAFIAIVFGVAIPAVWEWGSEIFSHGPADHPERASTKLWLSAFFYGILIVQLVILFYGPQNVIPKARDRAAGDALIRKLASYKGDIWLSYHGYYARLAGKKSYAMAQPVLDMLYADNKRANKLFNDDVERALRERKFEAIITDNGDYMQMGYRKDYVGESLRYCGPDDFWPMAGYRTRPSLVYVPQDSSLADKAIQSSPGMY
jgi:hypothetical protein